MSSKDMDQSTNTLFAYEKFDFSKLVFIIVRGRVDAICRNYSWKGEKNNNKYSRSFKNRKKYDSLTVIKTHDNSEVIDESL